jgi:arabinofuranosyltransferase
LSDLMGKHDTRLVSWMFVGLFGLTVIRNAWMTDDAYITLRTIENFLAGYGLTYNPFVRVQAFTHPLWLLLLSFAYFIQLRLLGLTTNNGLYLLTLLISIGLASAAVALVLSRISGEHLENKGIFIVAVLFSKAFMDYSTSGLENPLTYFLLTIFLYILFYEKSHLFWLAFLASLLALNRLDSLLIVIPALGYSLLHQLKELRRNTIRVLLGFLPFILWELFSIIYYGFPFPNTAYAKLNTGIGERLLLAQGLDYLINSLTADPVTLFVIGLAGVIVIIKRDPKVLAAYSGALLYLLYIVYIGGDFMTGRFLAAPFLVSAALLARSQVDSRQTALLVLSVLFILGITASSPSIFGLPPSQSENLSIYRDSFGVDDEKVVYSSRSGFIVNGFRGNRGGSRFAGANWVISSPIEVTLEGAIGLFGYQKGPGVYTIDQFALVDPLLARLPVKDKLNWRIGHFERDIPDGYLETLGTQKNVIQNPALAEYYEKLTLLTTGPLWNKARIQSIWNFNTGKYDALLKTYLATTSP